MNILFLQGTFPSYGGVERVTTLLANEFCKRGNGVHCISFVQPNPEIAERDLDKRVVLHKLNYPILGRENIKKLHKIIVDNNIDVVINQWAALYKVALIIRAAIKGTNCKLITVHHTLPNNNNKIQKSKNAYEKSKGLDRIKHKVKYELIRLASRLSVRGTYHFSDIYMVLSPSYISIAKDFMYLSSTSKIKALPNPLGELPKLTELTNKENEILYVGRIDYTEKMTFRLLDVWELLQNEYPDWKLTFVGDGPDREDMEQRVSDMKLNRVSFEGFQEPYIYYKRAKVVVLCSAYEGFPMVLIEGMSHQAVPVSVGSFPSVFDIIDNEKNGIIVQSPYSDKVFAEALERLLNNQNLLNEFKSEAYMKSFAFTTSGIVDQWEKIFKILKQ